MIGKTLQEVLKENGVNVNELANMISVSPQTLYSIIKRDNMKIDFEVLLKICSVLNVSVERFYSDYLNETSNISIDKKKSECNCLDLAKQQLINNYDILNDIGRKKLLEYSDDLVNSGNYILNEQKEKHA